MLPGMHVGMRSSHGGYRGPGITQLCFVCSVAWKYPGAVASIYPCDCQGSPAMGSRLREECSEDGTGLSADRFAGRIGQAGNCGIRDLTWCPLVAASLPCTGDHQRHPEIEALGVHGDLWPL